MLARNVGTVILMVVLFAGLGMSLKVQSAGETIARFSDVRGDDAGAGQLFYPEHAVYVPGLFDLLGFEVSRDASFVYFDLRFAALTNPFQAPEGYFHQRIEILIRTGESPEKTDIPIGSHTLQTGLGLGWNVRLSVAPFDESRLIVVGEDGQVQVLSEEVISGILPDNQTIRVQVNSDALPQPDSAWGYYVLVGSFDGLAQGSWRDLGDGPWQVGGEGLPVFDLLSPRFGRRSQKNQLSEGVLYPVYASGANPVIWLSAALGVVLVLGVVFIWRWRLGRS